MTTSYKYIRKAGKARWVYVCPNCEVETVSADLFRALESKQQHQLTSAHVFTAMAQAFQPVAAAFVEMAEAAMSALEPLTSLFAVPTNRPHDPALLADKRKWGGR